MSTVISMNPFECKMWEMHDRITTHITESSCRAEIESVRKHGQRMPVLGRPLKDDPHYKVELIYGARRLFVARHLNTPLLVELRQLSDVDAIVAMDIENRMRRDISPYERGLCYARWLREGYFKSQDDIARALHTSAPQVSRLLKLTRIPAVVVAAFQSPTDISESWGIEIAEGLDDPDRRSYIVRSARNIARQVPRPAAREVYRSLISASTERHRTKRSARDEVVTDASGKPLFRIRQQTNSIALLIRLSTLTSASLEDIRREVADILTRKMIPPRSVEDLKGTNGGRNVYQRGEGERTS